MIRVLAQYQIREEAREPALKAIGEFVESIHRTAPYTEKFVERIYPQGVALPKFTRFKLIKSTREM
ncbi:MAG: hypothetical protein Kow0042_23630 [Calditrichia bacterium]